MFGLRKSLNLFKMQPRCFATKAYGSTGARNTLPFQDTAEDFDPKKVYAPISLDDFYGDLASFTLTDKETIDYITFAAQMARVKFSTTDEMLKFKADF